MSETLGRILSCTPVNEIVTYTSIPDTLKTLRHDLGLKQRAAARMIAVSRSLWGQWETGLQHPRSYHLSRIREVFKIEIHAA